ncbi:MAG: type II toxin-antitoxin system RelE/ParE family toxin [Oscillospiraceae bacterium]|nr:type II toxin-antitoxin system RelE/ParE family toxin [Oscillospiraceae bacterium]
MNNILYSPKAQADLDEIWDYISDKLQSPSAAQNTVNGILDTIEMLREQVEIGKPLYFSSGLYSGYRYLIYRNYLAFYRIVSDTVYIDRVIYGKRDYMRLLFGGAEE